ncbi:MAG: hypothetical protein WD342_04210 [Verrucomicrobiales bacterium]
MLRDYRNTLLRWLLGTGFFGLSFWCVQEGLRETDYGLIFSAVPLFLFGVAAFWKTIFHLATRPLILMVDAVFFPGGELPKPVLNLKLPSFYINEGRYDEALTEYRKILKYYPDEIEAYEKAIWLYCEIFEEPREARKLVARARRRHLALDKRVVRHAEDSERAHTRKTP